MKLNPTRIVACAALSAALLAATPALGQTPADKTAAQVAFDKAIALMKQGEIKQACVLLEDSWRLDPAMGTQYQLGQCYEKSERLASAWASYTAVADAAKAAGMADREKWARDLAAKLEPKLSKLTIVVPPKVAALAELSIERDGQAVPRSLWGEAIPVDGGTHRVVARASGRSPWSGEITVGREQDEKSLELPMLPPAQQDETAPAAPATPARAPAPAGQPDETGDDGTGQTVAGIVVAGVGLAAITAGVVVGLVAKSDYDESGDEHCSEGFCDSAGIDAGEDARTLGNVATGLFIGGSAALVAGVVTWLTAPSGSAEVASRALPTSSAPQLDIVTGPGEAGLGLRARW